MLRSSTLLFLLLLAVTHDARATYSEAHLAGVDVHAVVERDGRVAVTHGFEYRVLAGALRSIAVAGFDDDWQFHPTAKVTSSDARVLGAAVTRDDKGVVHVTVDDAKGLKRGDYRFEIVYEGTLGARVMRDGAFDRVRFALPTMREGIDGARVVLDFPPAPTEPRAMTEGDMAADLATLRRSAEHDEIELVRPHVPKGEAAAFSVRVDPKALPQLPLALQAPPAPPPLVEMTAHPPFAVAVLGSLCALFVFALGLAKERVLRGRAVGLLPGPALLHAIVAALSFAAGVLAQAQGRVMLGAALVTVALPFLAWRVRHSDQANTRARTHGTWLVVTPTEAFATSPSRDFLDATTMRGAMMLTGAIAFAMLAAWLVRAFGSTSYFIAIDAFVLAPMFFTGTKQQMPPNARREAAALAPIARALEGNDELRVSPLVRALGDGSSEETRLLVSPRLAMAGVSAIEVGVAWERAGGAMIPSFDVLMRVHDDSFAAAKMTACYAHKRALPGRKPEERAYRFEPEWPSVPAAACLVLELANAVRDRRMTIAARVENEERRAPPKRAAPKGASLA